MIDGIEIDLLPIGERSGSADALLVRWNDDGVLKVLVYNGGGSHETGMALVRHIRRVYGTDRVDYVVAAYLDARHVGGLSEVLEHLDVGELWIHQPWNYSEVLSAVLKSPEVALSRSDVRARRAMLPSAGLVGLAQRKGVLVQEAFAGSVIGVFTVLSPGHDAYLKRLLPGLLDRLVPGDGPAYQRLWRTLSGVVAGVASLVPLSGRARSVTQGAKALASLETSVTLHTSFYGHGVLLLGCAGDGCIRASIEYAAEHGLSLGQSLQFVQIPNAAGKARIGDDTLDRLLGNPLPPSGTTRDGRVAFVSAERMSLTHPRQSLIGQFERRGFRTVATNGYPIRKVLGEMPERSEWVPQSLPVLLSRTET